MDHKKISLYVIITLLVIFLPVTIFATATHIKNTKPVEVNPEHKFKLEGKLYFYQNNELLGTYECKNFSEYCDYAIANNNSEYALEEYREEKATKLQIINNQYAFLMDTQTEDLQNSEIILYDIKNEQVLGNYTAVKNYGIGIENNKYILKKDKNWGVVQFNNGINVEIPFEYEYIGLLNQKSSLENTISSKQYVALKNGRWQLIDEAGTPLTTSFEEEIVKYNEEYIILSKNQEQQIIDYHGNSSLAGTYKSIDFYEDYIEIIDNNNAFYLYDLKTNKMISKKHNVTNRNDIKLNKESDNIHIYIGDVIAETIAIR